MSKSPLLLIIPAACMALVPVVAQNSEFESTESAAGDAVEQVKAPTTQQAPIMPEKPTEPSRSYKTMSGPSSKSGGTTPAKCDAVKARLAQLQGQEEVLWSSQNEAGELYQIWSSPTCVSARQGRSDIATDLNNAMLLLKSNGTDIEQELEQETSKCDGAAATKWAGGSAEFRSQHSKAALAETCMLNTRITLYGKALNRLNQNSADNYATAQAEYEAAEKARQKKIADDKAAWEAEHAEWKRRSKLCNQGKIKYCASE